KTFDAPQRFGMTVFGFKNNSASESRHNATLTRNTEFCWKIGADMCYGFNFKGHFLKILFQALLNNFSTASGCRFSGEASSKSGRSEDSFSGGVSPQPTAITGISTFFMAKTSRVSSPT